MGTGERTGQEPTRDCRFDERRHGAAGRERDALLPGGGTGRRRRAAAIANGHPVHPLGMVPRQAERRDPAHRHAHDRGRADIETVKQGCQIIDEARKGAIPGRDRRAAMAALVVTQDAEPIGEDRDLLVPQAEVGHQRVREDQPRCRCLPLGPASEHDIVDGDTMVFSLHAAHGAGFRL